MIVMAILELVLLIYIFVDFDINSMYPNIIRSLKVCQKHLLPKAWFRIADTIVDERLEHKHLSKDKFLIVKREINMLLLLLV